MVGSERRTCFETECVMALQGHPRSLILAPVTSRKRVCDFLLVISPTLPRFGDIAGFLRRATQPYCTRIFGVFPLDYIADVVAPGSEDRMLIIRVITFELTQHIRSRYLNVTDGRKDRRTDDLR